MIGICILLISVPLSMGLQIEEENLQKVLDDTIQNTELDGDNLIDFPAWTADSQTDGEDQPTGEMVEEEAEEAQDTNEKTSAQNEDGVNKISDFINLIKSLSQHFNRRKENTPNHWTFWKDFVHPHQNNIWSHHFGLQSQDQVLRSPWSNLRDIFNPTTPPPVNWWEKMFSAHSRLDSPDSMITIYHKMTVDNNTREGVAKVPSSQLMPFMRTVWNNLSSDSHLALGLGALLPFLGLLLPLMIFAVIVPILLLVMVSVFGLMSGSLVLLPLLLTGLLGQDGLPVDRMIEELFLDEFGGNQFWNDKLENTTEKSQEDETTDEAVEEVEEIPRYLGF